MVDTLDEIEAESEMETFLCNLSKLADWRPAGVKVLATSRAAASVECVPRGKRLLNSRLNENDVNHDLDAYSQD